MSYGVQKDNTIVLSIRIMFVNFALRTCRGQIYIIYGVHKEVETSEIALCFAKRLNVRCFY